MKDIFVYYCNIFTIIVLFIICGVLYYDNSKLTEFKNSVIIEKNNELNIKDLRAENDELKRNIKLLKDKLNNVKVKSVNHGLNVNQLRNIVKNVVKYLDEPNVVGYTELILITAIIESNNGYFFKQVKGPALGVFQMEPRTEKCLWDNYLKYNKNLKKKIENLKANNAPGLSQLETNMAYSIAMTYAHYKRTGKKVPNIKDKLELVKFHKKYYNTEKGKSRIETSLDKIVGIL